MCMRRFHFLRKKDASGVSGIGIVAEGVIFSNGKVAVEWLSNHASTNLYDSLSDVETIHGHQGMTEIIFEDPDVPDTEAKKKEKNDN